MTESTLGVAQTGIDHTITVECSGTGAAACEAGSAVEGFRVVVVPAGVGFAPAVP